MKGYAGKKRDTPAPQPAAQAANIPLMPDPWPWPAPVAPSKPERWQYLSPSHSGLEPFYLRQQDGKSLREPCSVAHMSAEGVRSSRATLEDLATRVAL